jgi:hypothetical protein
MSDVARLEAELELAKLTEHLEEAREAFHANRSNEKNLRTFKDAEVAVATARQAFRMSYRVVAGPGDAAPTADTVALKAGVKL